MAVADNNCNYRNSGNDSAAAGKYSNGLGCGNGGDRLSMGTQIQKTLNRSSLNFPATYRFHNHHQTNFRFASPPTNYLGQNLPLESGNSRHRQTPCIRVGLRWFRHRLSLRSQSRSNPKRSSLGRCELRCYREKRKIANSNVNYL